MNKDIISASDFFPAQDPKPTLFSTLKGKTLRAIKGGKDSEELLFVTTEGKTYRMWYEEDCCASCSIEDIAGDLQDLIGLPLLQAEEYTEDGSRDDGGDDSATWTFYKLATNRGRVTIRWYGSSNGYYSERASFREVLS